MSASIYGAVPTVAAVIMAESRRRIADATSVGVCLKILSGIGGSRPDDTRVCTLTYMQCGMGALAYGSGM
jgi:hypothetical protein